MTKKLDLTLYLVLDTAVCRGFTMALETAKAAIDSGITMLQLRSEHMTGKEWLTLGEQIQKLLQGTSIPFIINNRLDIALALGADGVHMGQNDIPPIVTRKLLGPEKFIGLSISTPQELQQAPTDLVDYLGIGPVFATTSKQNTAPALGIDGLRCMIATKKLPAVGIGGITPANAASVKETGIEGIGVVSAVCGHSNPGVATQELMTAMHPLR